MNEDNHSRRIDVLAIGLFGLAVGALTLEWRSWDGFNTRTWSERWLSPLIFGGWYRSWPALPTFVTTNS